MANVLFTSYCNRRCSYCFARDKVDLGRDTGDLSMNLRLEGLEEIIRFYRRSQLTRFVILGGSPRSILGFRRWRTGSWQSARSNG